MKKIRTLYYDIIGFVFAWYSKALPKDLRKFLFPFFEKIYLTIQCSITLSQQIRQRSYVVSCKCGGSELRVLYIGRHPKNSFIMQATALDDQRIEEKGRVFLWDIRRFTRDCDRFDIIIFETNRLLASRTQRDGYFLIPDWVKFFLRVPDSMEEYLKNTRGIRSDLMRIGNCKYTYEVSYDPRKLALFYHEMYIPYINRRFSNLSYVHDYSFLKRLLKTGVLFFVKNQDEYVAGHFLIFYDSILWAKWLGIKDGSKEYMKKAVIGAMNYYTIQWAVDNKFKKIDFGLCRAFLSDGLFRYKRKWGMIMDKNNMNTRFSGFKVCNLSEGVRNFLKRNAFIFCRNGELEGLVCFDEESGSRKDLLDLYRRNHTEGLKTLNMLCLCDFLPEMPKNRPEDSGLRLVKRDFLFHRGG